MSTVCSRYMFMTKLSGKGTLPTEISGPVRLFDRFASSASHLVSRAIFFSLCVMLVLIWLPTYFLLQDNNTWQLIINTITTVITFLLVALLQNTQRRSDQAVQHKLNAIVYALADIMRNAGQEEDAAELDAALGLEDRETST